MGISFPNEGVLTLPSQFSFSLIDIRHFLS
ncbi:hypothetical protein FHT85_002039 [Rhizobium sp. BK312]|uniref:Uncharacterized protein n=1 Tax=Rhizobium miluonense TaxID=411945 RepID=A0ABU1SJQ1_9HYPH|nr:hypothetical protein [Rhizobium sp. BK312]MDR6899222.1 hypothetical protein [Rhizobium miluonense]